MANSSKRTLPSAGERVVIRDTQWLVRKVEPSNAGGYILHVIGISDIVRGKEGQFLSNAEDAIEILDPAQTRLVQDTSPNFRDSLLYVESLLRKTAPCDNRIHIGNKAAMDPVAYQLDPALKALDQPRQRILIADGVGLGKTNECGILLSELIHRGRGRRILVVTVKAMLTQFQKELWSRFAIPFTRLDSLGLSRVKEQIPPGHNPFHFFDKSIISVDTLKSGDYAYFLNNAWWDVIVVDEAHNVAIRGKDREGSLRARLATLLARRSDSLILLSATPHDGSPRSFASLMNMLDPTAIADPDNYGPDDIGGLYIRRFKEDVRNQVKTAFKKRDIYEYKIPASDAEEDVFATLSAAEFPSLDRNATRSGASHLFRTVLTKAIFSSPVAARKTIGERLKKLPHDASTDRQSLELLDAKLAKVDADSFNKYQYLVKMLKDKNGPFHFSGKADDRILIFSERLDTVQFLEEHLPAALKLKKDAMLVMRGSDSDSEQQEIVESFGKEDSKARILIATDVASEGINLHYLCHKMIHFDIPWSLMTFRQRNGRIDRYGQTHNPQIAYLYTDSRDERIKGDNRILELLRKKDDHAGENIKDPSAFLGKYEVDAEVDAVCTFMETTTAEKLQEQWDEKDRQAGQPAAPTPSTSGGISGFNALILNALNAPKPQEHHKESPIHEDESLFKSTYDFVCEGVNKLGLEKTLRDDDKLLDIPMLDANPRVKELKYRFRQIPRETRAYRSANDDWILRMSADKKVVMQSIAASQRVENKWPEVQYLWDLHPFMLWLTDAIVASYGRNEAPVLAWPSLDKGNVIVVLQGIFANNKGQPIVSKWFGVRFVNGIAQPDFPGMAAIFGNAINGAEKMPNAANPVDTKPLSALLPTAVALGKNHLQVVCNEKTDTLAPLLSSQLERLKNLKTAHLVQGNLINDRNKKESVIRQTNQIFLEHEKWIRDTLNVNSNAPFLRVAAVLTGA